jgi:hypothetical protein
MPARLAASRGPSQPAAGAVLEAEIVTQVSASTIWRMPHHADLRPHHHRMWAAQSRSLLRRKVTEVFTLHRHPPADGVVLSIDAKTGLQALERKYSGRRPQPGRRSSGTSAAGP